MKKTIFALIATLFVANCTVAPEKVDYTGCGARTLFWAIGPQAEEKYLDVCYTDINATEIVKYFDFVPISGINQDTRQALDANRDGISGNGRLLNTTDGGKIIRWGGNACKQYARRISQQNCSGLSDMLRTGGCEWFALQVIPKKGIPEAYVKFELRSRVRKADGHEYYNENKRPITTGFVNCP